MFSLGNNQKNTQNKLYYEVPFAYKSKLYQLKNKIYF